MDKKPVVNKLMVTMALSAMMGSANAGINIELDSNTKNDAIIEEAMRPLASRDVVPIIGEGFKDLVDHLMVDGKRVEFEVASTDDNTNSGGTSVCYNNCHCHSACHGSRGWR